VQHAAGEVDNRDSQRILDPIEQLDRDLIETKKDVSRREQSALGVRTPKTASSNPTVQTERWQTTSIGPSLSDGNLFVLRSGFLGGCCRKIWPAASA
jgi:hypothetical protein